MDYLFELQRGSKNASRTILFQHHPLIESALKALRRVNDYATAVRVFEGVKEKVENDKQYQEYLQELSPIKSELGILTKEEMGF